MHDRPLHTDLLASTYQPDRLSPYCWLLRGDVGRQLATFPEARRMAAQYRQELIAAERFVLTDDTVRQIVYASKVSARRMRDYLSMAHLPFNQVWIEWSPRAQVQAQIENGTSPVNQVTEDTTNRSGYLISRIDDGDASKWVAVQACCTEFFNKQEDKIFTTAPAYIAPYTYTVDCNENLDRVALKRRFASDAWREAAEDFETAERLSEYAWGYTFQNPDVAKLNSSEVTLHEPIAIIGRALAQKAGHPLKLADGRDFSHYAIEESRGNARFLVTLLAMINEVPITTELVRHTGSVRMAGQLKSFMSHRTISLVVPVRARKRYLERALMGAVSKKRRHRVRGHFRFYRSKDKTVWIEAHERGDASLGWVEQDYEVRTENDKERN